MENKYIKTIEIKGLQTHEDTTIELSPLFNTIIGENRAGKSAIVRALRLLFYNNPRDIKPLIRYGCNEIYIKLTMSDGSWVVRQKGEKINRYTVYIAGKHTEPVIFDNVGFSVPEDVYEATGVLPLSIGKDTIELNISSQFDPPFMISESGTNLARWLGHLSGITDVRSSIDSLRKDIRAEATKQKELNERIELLENQIKNFDGIEKVNNIVIKVLNDLKKGKEINEILDRISNIREQIKTREQHIAILQQNNQILGIALEKIVKLDIDVMSNLYSNIIKMTELKQKIEYCQKQLCYKEQLNNYAELLHNKIDIEAIKEKIDNVLNLAQIRKKADYYKNEINELSSVNEKYSEKLAEENQEYDRIIKEIFSFEDGMGVCPLCKQKVDSCVISEHYNIS